MVKLPDFQGFASLGEGKERGANEKAGRIGRATPGGGDPHASQKMKRKGKRH